MEHCAWLQGRCSIITHSQCLPVVRLPGAWRVLKAEAVQACWTARGQPSRHGQEAQQPGCCGLPAKWRRGPQGAGCVRVCRKIAWSWRSFIANPSWSSGWFPRRPLQGSKNEWGTHTWPLPCREGGKTIRGRLSLHSWEEPLEKALVAAPVHWCLCASES